MRIMIDVPARRLWMIRTAHGLSQDESGLREFYDQVVNAMAAVERADYSLLIDSRDAIGRNDETFERVQAEYRVALFGGFDRVVAVVRTFAGRLQVTRYGHGAEAIALGVCGSVEEALAFLDAIH